jgi:6-phosphofructokinase
MQEYKVKVRQYYQNVAGLPRIPEDAMQSYLKQLSEHQSQVFRKTGGFVAESALYELLRYANKYSDQMLSNLRNAGLDARAQVFESVVRATM